MLKLLKERRSIRKFTPKAVEIDLADQLVKAALLSPSSRGICPWEIIVVDKKETLEKLSRAKEHGSSFLAGAPLALLVLGEPEKSDVWIEDTSIISTIIHLTAHSLQLGSCWIQIRNRLHNQQISSDQYIKKLLAIPDSKQVESIIAIGYPAESKPASREENLQFNKVYTEKYGNKHFLNKH